ncbi:MAG: pyridoxamine 5'-phosphate oxidase family protein [Spirochaetales bacterium]|nr:pyridoxamine 5'-phosphate oxidase family protein [Spirochaetales bacterium]
MQNEEFFFEDRNELRALLSNCTYTTLALNDGNDSYILTLNYGLDEKEDILYFKSTRGGTKLDFLKSNPYLCGTVILENEYDAETDRTCCKSVVYYGLMEVIHKSDEKRHALETLFKQINREEPPLPDNTGSDEALVMKLSIDEMTGKRNPV